MKKSVAIIVASSIIASSIAPISSVFANEVKGSESNIQETIKENISKILISKFNLANNENIVNYDAEYKISKDNIKSISNNGGNYSSFNIANAIDGKLNTHWETGKPNDNNFDNEVVVEFESLQRIDRIVYATRQDSAKGKGFPTKVSIYTSNTGNDEDFKLIGNGAHASTGDLMEFKFDAIDTKKVKFVFDEANQNWASASEFWFYKEDKVINELSNLFTDSKKNALNEKYNTIEKLGAFESEAKKHPMYNAYASDFNHARELLNRGEVVYADAIVSKFTKIDEKMQKAYDNKFRVANSKVSTNGGHYEDQVIENLADGNMSNQWHSRGTNNTNFTNEVVLEMDSVKAFDRILFTGAEGGGKGFPEKFEVYVSETTNDDTYELLSKGQATKTSDTVEFKFNPVRAKRVKFVFKQGAEGWAIGKEMGLYKADTVREEMSKIFTDENKLTVSAEYNTIEKLEVLENKAKGHVLYEVFKVDFQDAKDILNLGDVIYADATISKFENASKEQQKAYDDEYLVPSKKITTNGGYYGNGVIERAIDGDLTTNWHSGKQNNGSFKNEVVLELDKLSEIDRILFGAARGTHRGFPEKFEVHVSPTTSGNNFELVSKGATEKTQDVLEFKFNPTKAKRVKFVFAQGYENWAEIGEIGVYTTDTIREKMATLFTDAGKGTVSETYNTVEKLDVLENEVKDHPLYSFYKEDLDNARIMLEDTETEVVKANAKVFDKYKVNGYDELFKMGKSNIKSIKNNAGAYGGQVIANVIDGKLDTYWETNSSNTSTFNNTVEITFNDKVVLDRVVTGARASDSKGFANEFEIYGSKTSTGDTYKLTSTGKHDKTGGVIEAKFQPTEFKRMKFVYKKSDQNWATASEFWFYSKDEVSDTINSIFTDGTQSKVKEGVTLETIEGLEEQLKMHPLKDELKGVLELAREVLENPGKYDSTVWEVPDRGDSIHESSKRKLWNFQDWQPTGYMAKPGDVIEVYVDVEDGAPTPQLVYKQMDSAHNGQIHIRL